jgi:hypothetical protein
VSIYGNSNKYDLHLSYKDGMRPRYSTIRDNRDSNHGQIVSYLRMHGIEVIETERPLDILIWCNGQAGWGEIKDTRRNAMVQRGQLEFMAFTEMPVAFIKTEGEALQFATTMQGLTKKQKNALAAMLVGDLRKTFHPALIERALSV